MAAMADQFSPEETLEKAAPLASEIRYQAIFEQADEVLGFPLSKLCFKGPEEELRLTINTQPALVTVSFACLKIAQEIAGGRGMMGYSPIYNVDAWR